MKKCLILSPSGLFLFAILFCYGCELALMPTLIEKEKNTMDLIGQAAAPVDLAWQAASKAAEDLEIHVDTHEFGENRGTIEAHAGELNFIRIHISQITPKSTRIGIQVRTTSYPLSESGYDRDFAQTIMDRIHKNVMDAYSDTREIGHPTEEEGSVEGSQMVHHSS